MNEILVDPETTDNSVFSINNNNKISQDIIYQQNNQKQENSLIISPESTKTINENLINEQTKIEQLQQQQQMQQKIPENVVLISPDEIHKKNMQEQLLLEKKQQKKVNQKNNRNKSKFPGNPYQEVIQKNKQLPQAVAATVKPVIIQSQRAQVSKQMMMDHGSEEGCKVLKGKRIEFTTHSKKNKHIFIQFSQTNQDAAQERKMMNVLYKRLDLSKSQNSVASNSEEEKDDNISMNGSATKKSVYKNTYQPYAINDNDSQTSEDSTRKVIFSEESLDINQQQCQTNIEQVFPNLQNETCFIIKKKSTQNGLVLDQLVYSDKIIEYMGHKVDAFQLLTIHEGTPTLLHGRESFFTMMKSVQNQANTYLHNKTIQFLPKDIVELILKTKMKALIKAKCGVECRLVEGSFYVKIDVMQTLHTNYEHVENEEQQQFQKNESTCKKLQRFSKGDQDFLSQYVTPIPDNELEYNQQKICGFKFIDETKNQKKPEKKQQQNEINCNNKRNIDQIIGTLKNELINHNNNNNNSNLKTNIQQQQKQQQQQEEDTIRGGIIVKKIKQSNGNEKINLLNENNKNQINNNNNYSTILSQNIIIQQDLHTQIKENNKDSSVILPLQLQQNINSNQIKEISQNNNNNENIIETKQEEEVEESKQQQQQQQKNFSGIIILPENQSGEEEEEFE